MHACIQAFLRLVPALINCLVRPRWLPLCLASSPCKHPCLADTPCLAPSHTTLPSIPPTASRRDPANRPSAKEALKHPWLQGNSSERSSGKQIDVSVVARIQRFAQNNRFKRSVLRLIAEELLARPGAMEAESAASAQRTASKPPGGSTGSGGIIGDKPIIQDPNAGVMQEIYSQLQLDDGKPSVDRDAAALALAGMGYRLDPAEVSRLLEQVDTSNSGRVSRAALAASQIDWRHLQANRVDDWLEIAHAAFATLDADSDGRISAKDIMDTLRAKLPPAELRMTVQQAMLDAGQDGALHNTLQSTCCPSCAFAAACIMKHASIPASLLGADGDAQQGAPSPACAVCRCQLRRCVVS